LVVNGIFSIPLSALESPASEALERSSALPLREYIGSDENRLVKTAFDVLLAGQSRYSPFVLHGPTGTGKTMLAHGLAERWREKHPRQPTVVTCGADFARSYAVAVDTDDISKLRKRYRTISLFVLDDLHELQRKAAAQGELLHTLDTLRDRGATVVLTHRQSPNFDDKLSAALRSRLSEGLSVPLSVPGGPARRLLLERLAAIHSVALPDGALDLLASNPYVRGNDQLTVPQLNSAVLRLGHVARTEKQNITVEIVRRLLSDEADSRRPTLRAICEKVCKYFSISASELRGPSRRRAVVRARGVAMYLAWNLSGKSLGRVGTYYGKRDHTTVLHACRKTESLKQSDPAIGQAIEHISQQLKGY
jgi:chromosomal replication initiator protein